jgi:anaerobic selenocysteine-containing dehydrogenase/Fe-S-cluster-containing dehydrogenase component
VNGGLSRRSFLKLAAAGAATAIPGCEPAARKLIPYVIPDENVIPGEATYYATTCAECPAGCGLIAKVREGRVIKLDGNPLDPISAGSICARGQAALQGLYNPDRLAAPHQRSADGSLRPISWGNALRLLTDRLRAAAQAGEGRVAFLGAPQGPTMARIATAWLNAWRSNRIVHYEPLNAEPERAAAGGCFGREDLPIYRLDKAEVVISFGADFLETWSSPVEMTRQYAAFRAPVKRRGALTTGRCVYVGPRFGLTAAKSDEWVAVRPGAEAAIALGVLNVVVNRGRVNSGLKVDRTALKNYVAGFDPASVSARAGVPLAMIRKMGERFGQADGALAITGADDPAAHAACLVLNYVTGNVGRTVLFLNGGLPPQAARSYEIDTLIKAMVGGAIEVLVVAGVNPLFSMPSSAGFTDAISRVPFVAWCGGVPDETAAMAHLLLPIHHPLESFGDMAPRAGVHDFAQPVTAPVFDSRPLGDVLIGSARSAPGGQPPPWKSTADALEATFRELYAARGGAGGGFEESWQRIRQQGGIVEHAEVADVELNDAALKPVAAGAPASELSVLAYPHIFLYDGRGADKPWLQELPEPVSQFVWDSWAEIHPETARQFGIKRDDVIELRTDHGVVELPAFLSVHVHPGAIAVALGQGHAAYGRYANGRGANAWRLLPAGRMTAPVKVRKTGKRRELVSPLGNGDMLGRSIIEAVSLDDLANGVKPPREEPPEPYEMYEPFAYPSHMWGMTIDVNACTGCSACVAACYAENNIPFVGKEMIDNGRIMSWIRIERFYPAKADAPPLYLAPMLCQQCDHAPCEPVCPVFASYRTDEGLNGQVYNRCIGTRYCENNCPYKVRRFNWFAPQWPAPLNLQLNPDVTVRGAGVMEKCTFCVQRIVAAEIDAKIEKRPVRDGEIIPACAQACPARAISFGDMNDPRSAMMRRRADNALRAYQAMPELNTKPAIVYLRDVYRRSEKV